MDFRGIAITIVGAVLYFVSKKKPIFLLVTGIGIGLFIGAIWAASIIASVFP